jgi:hypothetical protein
MEASLLHLDAAVADDLALALVVWWCRATEALL